jgi:threonine dehydratase
VTALEPIVALIPKAQVVVDAHLNRTEVRSLGWLTQYAGRSVVAKLETQQVTGSFKVRGALFALSRLEPGTRVVAPSAGNHGLAVAWAADRLGLVADVVLPQNASPLKRERILGLGAGVIDAGSNVEEASEEARRLAARSGWHYLSPFNDEAVVAGQATAVVELLDERPDVTSLVLSVGGGGLLAGAIAARAYLQREVHLLACEPDQFASMAASMAAGTVVRLGRRPTFADGLAANLEPDSITLDIALTADNLSFCTLSEEEIAAACVAVFNRESILAEGAATAGVAATVRAKELGLPDGVTATILCGGNVHHNTFWHMAAYPIKDPCLVSMADTMGRTVEDEPLRRQQNTHVSTPRQRTPDGETDLPEAVLPTDLMATIGAYTRKTSAMLDDLTELAVENSLPLDPSLVELVRGMNESVGAAVQSHPVESTVIREQRVRVLSQFAVAARLAFEWRSPAYDQSAALAEFDLGALGSPGVNYARFEQPGVSDVERQLAELLRISPETHAVLMTSSGMAAFALATATVFSTGPVRSALTAPYLYFEGMEMLRYWLADRVHVASSYRAEDIADEAAARRATVVLADPLTNHPAQRMIDVERLADALAGQDHRPWLVVDASMLPVVTAAPIAQALPDRVIYYESCSKYLQFGLDVTMAGMVVVPRQLEPLARRVRRNLGLGIDRYGVELFPRYRPDQFERRINAMENTALRVATRLSESLPRDHFAVTFPGLPDHVDHRLAQRLGRTGSCVTLEPLNQQLGRDQLDPIVDAAIREARVRDIPLIKGVSFGFTTSRISAASAMAEAAPPFIRLAVGALPAPEADALAEALRVAVRQMTAVWPR